MKELTISEKNFKRFAKRYQKLHNIGLMEAQEQLSQVLGCSNYHELNKNFQQQDHSYQQYNNFLIEVKESIKESYYTKGCLHYFDFRDDDIKYVCHHIEDIQHDVDSEGNPFDKKNISVIPLLPKQPKPKSFQRYNLFSKTKSIFDKYLIGKDVKAWKMGFISFLKSLPHQINMDGVYLLFFDKEYIIQSGHLVIPVKTQTYYDYGFFYQTYDVDYFSGVKHNRIIHENLDYLSEIKRYDHKHESIILRQNIEKLCSLGFFESFQDEYENITQTQIIDKVYGSRFIESFQDEWTTQSKEDAWDEDYWENIDDILLFSGDDLTIIETYDDPDHHES